MAKTIVEKILSKKAARDLKAGDFAVCKIDFAFGQDGTSNLIIDKINELKIRKIKIPFCMVIDHSSPAANEAIARVHKKMRQFCLKFKGMLFDIGCGICHQVIPEAGIVKPGDVIVGADSHTSTYGALGAFSVGMGSTDVAVSMACGKNWFKVPSTLKIIIKGNIPKGIYAKDIILYIIQDMKSDGANYKAIEFYGHTLKYINMDGRFTICNMVVEMGAKCGFMPIDKITLDWFKLFLPKNYKFEFLKADEDAHYEIVKEYNIEKLTPLVSCPHSVDSVVAVSEIKNVKINEAFLGTCTNGRLSDLKVAAQILKNKKIKKGVKFIVAPASKKIFLDALNLGLIDIFVKAGGVVISPGCGPCVGSHAGIPADNEIVISTANRNFKGRMGNPNSQIYLASPATVVASAISGKITDPRIYL
ncbi:MAG: 3-isopropylmalate dehydratase large subunit [Candidatus Omnitrophica bacterium]|nr:3-isopropylmalate dehydratase large subunit [Candidatus Omnitrophota bacterium]